MREQHSNDLLKKIRDIHETSRKSYGSPRVHAELTIGQGATVNRKRAERLMRDAGIRGAFRRRRHRSVAGGATQEDLVNRAFTAGAPGRLWASDITEHPTGKGKVYCAAVMDAYSRPLLDHRLDRVTPDRRWPPGGGNLRPRPDCGTCPGPRS
ncbi:MAG TPA: IS3 family transposase [Trebonia sp.]|jgi:putative transposase|nr:IS3 family transposase [Trebonia sp.]